MRYRVGRRLRCSWGEAFPYVLIAVLTVILFITQLDNVIGGWQ